MFIMIMIYLFFLHFRYEASAELEVIMGTDFFYVFLY